MTPGAIIGAAAIGAAAQNADNFINWGVNSWLNQQQQQMALDRMANEQAFNAYQANIQRNYEEHLANTSYQRAVADMEAAGLNPASMVGTSPSGAMVPNAAAASSHASGVAGSSFHGSNGLASMMSSAIQGMIAKDRDAAKFLADEFRDNAKHAHKLEEIHEAIQEKKDARAYLDLLKSRHYTDVEKYRYSHGHRSYDND